jgi:hypothetical protein
MNSGAEYFLKKTLGDDFMESLGKVELWKPGTKSTTDHEEIRTALQIVPRTIMALLIRELSSMDVGQNRVVQLFVANGATLNVTKHERDVYSGDIIQGGKKLTEFKFRSLPGIGLVVMTTFELYDMENLINTPAQNPEPPTPEVKEDISEKVQKIIDDRLALHDLIGKVVDKKIMERDAVHQLVLRKLSEMMEDRKKIVEITKIQHESTKDSGEEYFRGMTNGMKVTESIITHKEPNFINPPEDKSPPKQEKIEKSIEKKKRPLTEFLEKAKKKHEYSVVMAKGETADCPDCGKNIFDGKIFASCICFGDAGKVFIKKSEDGIKVRFSKGWDEENIEMLLEVLRKKHG